MLYPDSDIEVEIFDHVTVNINGQEHEGQVKAIYPRARTVKVHYDTWQYRGRTSSETKWATWNFPIAQVELVRRDG